MIDWLHSKIAELTVLLQAGFTLGAIAMVGIMYIKTRAVVALLVAALTAGIFLWTIHNASWWQDRIGEETEIEGNGP